MLTFLTKFEIMKFIYVYKLIVMKNPLDHSDKPTGTSRVSSVYSWRKAESLDWNMMSRKYNHLRAFGGFLYIWQATPMVLILFSRMDGEAKRE